MLCSHRTPLDFCWSLTVPVAGFLSESADELEYILWSPGRLVSVSLLLGSVCTRQLY